MSDSMIKIEDMSTEQLTAEANVQYRQAESLAQMSITMLADVGRKLAEIKSRIPHGGFEEWCDQNLVFSKRQADRYMDLASKIDDKSGLFSNPTTLSDIGISKIWALLAAPEEVAAEVVEENDVADMSVRELKDEISRLKEEKEETDKEKDELAEAKKKQDKEQARLDASLAKAKEDLKKAKEKLDKMKADQSGEIQKAVEEKTAEAVKRVREENAESIKGLSEQIERLEEEKAKLSNTSVMEFRFLIDQLQDTYFKASDLIAKQRVQDEETAEKMKAALKKIIEGWE